MTQTLDAQLVKLLLHLERYYPTALASVEINLELAQKEILDLIANTQNQRTIRRELKRILQNAFVSFNDDMIADIETVAEISYNKIGAIMATGFATNELTKQFKGWKSIDSKVKDKLLSEKRLILGNSLDDMKNQMILGANNKLRASILKGFEDKVGIDAINKDVKVIVGNLSRNQARTVTRTVLLNAIEDSKNEAFSYFEDEIDYYVYSSVLDNRTTPYCMFANGYKTKSISDAKYKPKTHWNCRSTWTIENEFTRMMDDERNLVQWSGKEVNHRDGTKSTKFKVKNVKQVPKNVKGDKLFSYFDEQEKLNYLGKTRYQLYKSGKATFREMVDLTRNKLVPIDEIVKYI